MTSFDHYMKGITPACAGRRRTFPAITSMAQDHPRVRGEKEGVPDAGKIEAGSPPRARGEDGGGDDWHRCGGITPACAGRSGANLLDFSKITDHPRVRGEKHQRHGYVRPRQGSPPRARGEEQVFRTLVKRRGITPACAGRSDAGVTMRKLLWDHPRVRGEKFSRGRY